jgi:hypothetical protein
MSVEIPFEHFLPVLFFCVGIAFVIYARKMIERVQQSEYWPMVTGRITRSDIRRMRSSNNSNGWEAVVEYTYFVDREYEGKTLSLGGTFGKTRKKAQAHADQYTVGAPVQVYYDPATPGTACLERTTGGAWLTGVVGAFFAVFGLLAFLGVIHLE